MVDIRGLEPTPASPAAASGAVKLNVILFCGSKYSFRSVYVPALRELSAFAVSRVYLLDYPQDYEIESLLEELQASGTISSYTVIPNNRHRLRHHRALGDICRSLPGNLDLLIVDDVGMPVHKYFVHGTRERQSAVVILHNQVSHLLMAAYESAVSQNIGPVRPSPLGNGNESVTNRLFGLVGKGIQRPHRVLPAIYHRGRRAFWSFVEYRLLPSLYLNWAFLVSGAFGKISSTCADGIITYSEKVKQALQYFSPKANVIVAQHPLAGSCRCNGLEPKTGLLVALSGPWSHWIKPGNPAESIEDRWCQAVLKAVTLKGFPQIDIRPHPREPAIYPSRLAARLCELGVNARVVDSTRQTLPETICNYAGVIGAPSSLLAEAVVSCDTAFVIGLQDVELENYSPSIQSISDSVVSKRRGVDLTEDDFTRMPLPDDGRVTVCDALRRLMGEARRDSM